MQLLARAADAAWLRLSISAGKDKPARPRPPTRRNSRRLTPSHRRAPQPFRCSIGLFPWTGETPDGRFQATFASLSLINLSAAVVQSGMFVRCLSPQVHIQGEKNRSDSGQARQSPQDALVSHSERKRGNGHPGLGGEHTVEEI